MVDWGRCSANQMKLWSALTASRSFALIDETHWRQRIDQDFAFQFELVHFRKNWLFLAWYLRSRLLRHGELRPLLLSLAKSFFVFTCARIFPQLLELQQLLLRLLTNKLAHLSFHPLYFRPLHCASRYALLLWIRYLRYALILFAQSVRLYGALFQRGVRTCAFKIELGPLVVHLSARANGCPLVGVQARRLVSISDALAGMSLAKLHCWRQASIIELHQVYGRVVRVSLDEIIHLWLLPLRP